ncbi:EscU/YscU/HrcU family type III secretion system export apparatus switch protein [Bradyrhizobium xenonodulans]|uniref:EscU/YscU/HrcU family type III secretion system export apparatus switch protein n=1 Tax=Bradyrhizobium xenonodulans TaxID=2736875 RepID=A0ABY7MUS8_9BRAD|nr:EscU/YscU/HrcU family type III secretion system export apparatus switch protein [Bradyrhizobium xenonodulans]WBL81356.1 EscU/YscU/HrcU family type III secretion system export apparatus switch protein [Bradyrhizobium xenonodulans]
MSSDSGEEKTLPASSKKLEDARKKGQIAHSADLVSAAGGVAAILYLWIWSETIVEDWRQALTFASQIETSDFDSGLRQLISVLLVASFRTIAPLVALVLGASLLANVIVNRGLLFSLEPIKPKLDHINPFTGLGRMFGLKSWIELAKTLFKTVALAAVFLLVVLGTWKTLVLLPACGMGCFSFVIGVEAKLLLGIAAGCFLAAAAVDLFVQRWLFLREMRMTPSEAKREMQELEGNPLIRSAHQRLRRESAAEPRLGVKQATLVVVGRNAAIGLRYVAGETGVPMVVCRGSRAAADRIVAEARGLGTPFIEDIELARLLMRRARLGAAVPPRLFNRVAKAIFSAGLAG